MSHFLSPIPSHDQASPFTHAQVCVCVSRARKISEQAASITLSRWCLRSDDHVDDVDGKDVYQFADGADDDTLLGSCCELGFCYCGTYARIMKAHTHTHTHTYVHENERERDTHARSDGEQ